MRALAVVAAIVAAVLLAKFGTLSPCGMLRETVRQHDGLAAALPDSIVDLALVGQYGALSPDRCLGILMSGTNTASTAAPNTVQVTKAPPTQPAPQTTVQNPAQWAFNVTTQATNECRARRLKGELRSYAASAQCANPAMLQAFRATQYKHMDLIEAFAAKRLELATRIDRGELTEDQVKSEIEKAFAAMQAVERRREQGM